MKKRLALGLLLLLILLSSCTVGSIADKQAATLDDIKYRITFEDDTFLYCNWYTTGGNMLYLYEYWRVDCNGHLEYVHASPPLVTNKGFLIEPMIRKEE